MPRDHHPLDDNDWRDKVVYASVHANLLNDWERGFVDNMLGWDGQPTDKQASRIDVIYNKVKAKTEADGQVAIILASASFSVRFLMQTKP